MPNLMNESFTLPCGQVIKNRFCKAAMTERIAKGNNLAHQGHVNLYDRWAEGNICLLYTSPSPRDGLLSRMPSSA